MQAPGVPLAHYMQDHTGVTVRFTCCKCMASRDVSVEDVVARLKARSLGDEQTGVRAVAGLAERPCGRCGAMAWETRPVFPL